MHAHTNNSPPTHIFSDTHVSWSSFAWWDVKIQLSWMASHPKGPLVKLGFQGTPGIVKPTLSLTGRLSKSFLFCSENVFVFFLKKLSKPKSSTIFLVIICWRMQSLQLQKPRDQQPSTGHVPTVAFVNVLMSHCHNGANLALALTMNLRQEHCCL